MKVLITGASGFTGRHLVEVLTAEPNRPELFLTSRTPLSLLNYTQCELGDAAAVERLIADVKPDQIYHLAGTFTNKYDVDHRGNVLSSKNILESVHKLKISCRILLIGSAAEYGLISDADNPVAENHALKPVGVYGLTKMFQTHLMDYFRRRHGANVVMARPFNLIGTGQSSLLFLGNLYDQIERYQRREIKRITVGNLKSKRDYIPVKEAIKAYRLLMNHGLPGEAYNVGTGKSISIEVLLKSVLQERGLDMSIVDCDALTLPHTTPTDVPDIYADIRKLNSLQAQISAP
jgi:GDP-4-dehydro-6-deoxy-D-mannose reductase